MGSTRNEDYRDIKYMHDECEKNMLYHIILTMKDGTMIDGIIEQVEPDRIIILIGEDVIEEEDNSESNGQRQVFGYGRPRRRFRRFRRRGIPLGSLAALSLLQYPYFAPLYPHYDNYYYDHDDHDYDHDHHHHDDDDHDHNGHYYPY